MIDVLFSFFLAWLVAAGAIMAWVVAILVVVLVVGGHHSEDP